MEQGHISVEGTRNYYVTVSDPCGNEINSHISEVIVTPKLTPDGNGIIYVTESGSGNNSGNSWANATSNLQNALTANVQQIWVASGTYFPDQGGGNAQGDRHATFNMRNNLAIYGGFNGTEIELSDRNIAANPTLLSGNINGAGNTYSVVTSQGTDNTSRIDGFIITGGNALGTTFDAGRGGGIHVGNNSTAIIANCIIRGNEAHWGGGIYTKTNTNPTIINCLITDNTAVNGGGGICNSTNGSSTVINSTIANNTKQGVQNFANVSSILKNCIVWGNELGISNNTIVSNSIVQGQNIFPGQGNLNTDPLFVDASNGNYHLQKSTSARNRGKDEANQETIDLDGNPRKVGTIDLGPYESVALPPITPDANGIVYVTMSGGSGDFSGSSWTNATHDIQKAINGTNVQEVWVKGGTYKPSYRANNMSDVNPFDRNNAFVLKNDVKIFGGFAGTEMALSARDLSITTNASILSGDLARIGDNIDNAFHVIISAGDVGTAELNGFTIIGGNADGFSTQNVSSEMIFQSDGGGIFCSGSSPLLTNLTVSENNAALSGGGIYVGEGSPVLKNLTVSENNANSSGGGIYITLSSPIMTNIILIGNYALYYGGGISNTSSSSSILMNATINGNWSDEYGGGVYNNSSHISMTNSSISGNSSIIGGGISSDESSSSILTNVTISGNKDHYFGGGINNENNSLEIHNSIIYGNSKGYDGNFPDIVGPVSIITHSLVGGLMADDNGNIGGDTDPLFVNPLSPGLSTNGDYSLLENSPAINAGNNAAYPYLDANTKDLAGNPRLFGGTIDMGAYEHNDCPSGNILYVNVNATGENDGSSWTDAFTNLQDALSLSCANINEIWVAKGTYQPAVNSSFVMKNGVAIYGGFNDTENPTMEDRDWKAYPTLLKGNGNRVINNSFTSADPLLSSAILDGFTLTEGTVTGQSQSGAGIYNNYASPVLTNLKISGNNASWNGGGIFNNNSSPTLTNSIVSGNKASWGGGIYNNSSSFPIITNVTISGNNAISGGGGVINVNSSPKIRNSIIYGNSHGVNDFGGNSFSEITYSLVQESTDETNGNVSGAKNPMFAYAPSFYTAPFAGGDYRLLSSVSPAYNKGNNAFYNVGSTPDLSAITTDLAGEVRIYNGVIDLGAYENNGCPPGNIVYVNASATGVNDGSSWINAFTNLQNALALSCTDATQIWVANGIYYPDQGGGKTLGDRNATFTMKNNLAIYGGFAGTETSTSQRNLAANSTILSGDIGTLNTNTDNTFNIVTSPGTNNTSRLDGFIITGGNTPGVGSGNGRGGGIHHGDYSTAVIANCIIQGNHAQFGGGIYTKSTTNPTIINCLITGNTASEGGGGICNSTHGSSTIINTTISGNTKHGVQNFLANSSSTLKNCIIWGNGIGIGGGGPSTVSNSIIQGGGYITNGNLNADPLFVSPLSPGLNIGGGYSLHASSPAINTGSNQAYIDASGNLVSDMDLAGNPRLIDDIIDMGAFEYQNSPPNDNCSNVITLSVNEPGDCAGNEMNGTTINASSSGIGIGCEPLNPDVFYTFNSGNNTQVIVNIGTLDPQIDIVLTVLEESCDGETVSCNYEIGSTMVDVNPLTNYIVRVSSNLVFGNSGNFTICVESVYDCPALSANIGDACDDGDSGTNNDTVNENCTCVGTPDEGNLNVSVAWNSSCGQRDATLKLYPSGTATEIASFDIPIQSDGAFNILDIPIGTFDVIVKVEGYLAKGTRNVVIAPGGNSLAVGAIIFGDINNDNIVDFIDLGALSGIYLSQVGQVEYDPIADSNCDGIIDFVDLGALSGSYLIMGHSAPLTPSGDE